MLTQRSPSAKRRITISYFINSKCQIHPYRLRIRLRTGAAFVKGYAIIGHACFDSILLAVGDGYLNQVREGCECNQLARGKKVTKRIQPVVTNINSTLPMKFCIRTPLR